MSDLSDIHSLQSAMRDADTRRRHLEGLIGQHMNAFDKTLQRINGRKIARTPHSTVSEHTGPQILSGIDDILKGSLRQFASWPSLPNGASNGQLMADLARQITRAMRRNL